MDNKPPIDESPDSQMLSRRSAAAIVVLCVGAISAGSTFLQAKTEAPQATTELAQAFVDLGIEHCMDRVDDVSGHILNQGKHASMIYFAEADPERQMLSVLVGRGGDNDNYLATIDFSQNEKCSATYEITRLWSNNCAEVVQTAFAGYKPKGAMPGGFELFERNANLHVAVTGLADNGCLSVQKEVIF